MANMSYCRFWNTSKDVEDCINALYGGDVLKDDEFRACERMFGMILNYFEENGVIEVDWDEFGYWLDRFDAEQYDD